MTAQKHTPGQWRVEERSSYFGVFAKPPQDWYDRVRLVAVCAKPHPDAAINARLIAAAPDLLEMLKVAQLWLEVDGRYDMQGINAALTKAEGQP